MKQVDISKLMVGSKYYFPVSKKITTGVYLVDVPLVSTQLHKLIKEEITKAFEAGKERGWYETDGSEIGNLLDTEEYLKKEGYEKD